MADKRTIVIVEDEPDTAEMLAEMMRLSGFSVVQSNGGMGAVALISEVMPAAIILDVMMPDIPGLDILQYLHKDPRLRDIPVIMVSAKGLPMDIKSGLDAGAKSYLTKPVAYQDLKQAVQEALQSSSV